MKKVILAAACALILTGVALAQSPASAPATAKSSASGVPSCEARAVDKNGKPLAGAAKASFMKKCEADNAGNSASSCETKAVGKNGKPLTGAAKSAFVKKCQADSGK